MIPSVSVKSYNKFLHLIEMSLKDGVVRWGIVGAGFISGDFVNAIINNLDPTKHQVVAVAARYMFIS